MWFFLHRCTCGLQAQVLFYFLANISFNFPATKRSNKEHQPGLDLAVSLKVLCWLCTGIEQGFGSLKLNLQLCQRFLVGRGQTPWAWVLPVWDRGQRLLLPLGIDPVPWVHPTRGNYGVFNPLKCIYLLL